MLCHWLAAQEEFSIKRRQAKKTSLKNATKLKSESKCWEKVQFFSPKFDDLKKENIVTEYSLLIFIFRFFAKFRTKKNAATTQWISEDGF
jgi:hypothetical protein